MGIKGANLDVEEPENVNQYRLLRISISFCVTSLILEKSLELGLRIALRVEAKTVRAQ